MIQIYSFLLSDTPAFLTHIATHVGLSGPLIFLQGLIIVPHLPAEGFTFHFCLLLPPPSSAPAAARNLLLAHRTIATSQTLWGSSDPNTAASLQISGVLT